MAEFLFESTKYTNDVAEDFRLCLGRFDRYSYRRSLNFMIRYIVFVPI